MPTLLPRMLHPDRSLANIGAGVFAILAMWSADYAWIATDRYTLVREVEYRSEMIVFLAAAAVLLSCGARAMGLIDKRVHAVVGLAASGVALGAALWVCVFIVGDSSNHLSPQTIRHDATFAATPALTMAIISSAAMAALIALHCFAWVPGRHLRVAGADWTTRSLALFALLGVAAAGFPWIRGVELLDGSLSDGRALAAVFLSLALGVLVFRRARDEIDDDGLLGWAMAISAANLAVLSWLYIDVTRSADPVHEKTLVFFEHAINLQAAAGTYISLFAASAAFITASPVRAFERLRVAISGTTTRLRT